MPRRIRDVKLRNSRPTQQERLYLEEPEFPIMECDCCGSHYDCDIYDVCPHCEGDE